MKVLVLGSAGFIGHHLIQGHEDWHHLDLKDGEDLTDGFEGDYDFVIFLAAYLGHTKEDYSKNLELYSALADYLVYNKTHVIFTSSAAVYRDSFIGHIEKEMLEPPTLYGKSKLIGEIIIQSLASSYTILRLANVYGEGGRGVIDRFKKGGQLIFGTGEQVRDYVAVETVVSAIEEIITNPQPYRNEVFNISTGLGRTVDDVFKEYGRGEAVHVNPRGFDVQYSVLANNKAREAGLL